MDRQERSFAMPICLLAGALGAIGVGTRWWIRATDPQQNGIERIIEADREHFRSMQPIWDDYEAQHPGWQRPEPTSEAEYQRWRASFKN